MSEKSNVERIYPESKTGLINWIEEHFHEIDEFIFIAGMKSDSADDYEQFVYDCYSYRNAITMLEIAKDTAHSLSHDNNFIPKRRTKEG